MGFRNREEGRPLRLCGGPRHTFSATPGVKAALDRRMFSWFANLAVVIMDGAPRRGNFFRRRFMPGRHFAELDAHN